MTSIVLRMAYVWDCPACGSKNYSYPVPAVFEDGEQEEAYRFFNNLDDWEPLPDDWEDMRIDDCPEVVSCSCGMVFDAVIDGAEDISDDD